MLPPKVTGPMETGGKNPEPTPVVVPAPMGTVTSSGGGCALDIDAETIHAGAGRLTVVNETNRPVSFDLFRMTSGSVLTFGRLEAFVASEKRYLPNGPGGEILSPPTGAILLAQREVRSGASGSITDNFTTGAFAVVCAYPHAGIDIFRNANSPFALVGPIVVT